MDERLIAQGDMMLKRFYRGVIVAILTFFLFKMQTHFTTGHYWMSAFAGVLAMLNITSFVPQLLMLFLIGSALMSPEVVANLTAWLKTV